MLCIGAVHLHQTFSRKSLDQKASFFEEAVLIQRVSRIFVNLHFGATTNKSFSFVSIFPML